MCETTCVLEPMKPRIVRSRWSCATKWGAGRTQVLCQEQQVLLIAEPPLQSLTFGIVLEGVFCCCFSDWRKNNNKTSYSICLCLRATVSVKWGWRIARGSRFSPSTLKVPGTELRLSGLGKHLYLLSHLTSSCLLWRQHFIWPRLGWNSLCSWG